MRQKEEWKSYLNGKTEQTQFIGISGTNLNPMSIVPLRYPVHFLIKQRLLHCVLSSLLLLRLLRPKAGGRATSASASAYNWTITNVIRTKIEWYEKR